MGLPPAAHHRAKPRAPRYSLAMTKPCTFQLNRRPVDLAGSDPTESLLRWLRRQQLAGTKEGCADGDCGACTVALLQADADGTTRMTAVNSCLLPLGALPGREVLTVEALRGPGGSLHPVQQALVDCAGSQCGYCTPGFVMSLFAGYYGGDLGDAAIEGNLCRCTGYRPIRDAAAALARQPVVDDAFAARLREPVTTPAGELAGYHSPTTIADAIALKQQVPQAVWIGGATDLGVELSHGRRVATAFIALDRIAELQALDIADDAVRIGAGLPLSQLETRLAGVFPALDQMLPWFAARQVRNRATFGGNLGTASPIGDLLPVLLALDATVHLHGPAGGRDIAITDYFHDYRKTARQPDELVVAVTVPRTATAPAQTHLSASYKVAKRQTDDISIVAAVFDLVLDAAHRVERARLAYGGVAATPRRAVNVEAYLLGRRLDADTVNAAQDLLRDAFTPLDDHRAGADYRRALCAGLFAKFVATHLPGAAKSDATRAPGAAA
ncbi:MAG TPA: FAD binding domain-containing protein [Tahibacter sp.]|uniref:xanthine dehydrogenase small subunit n=1 Tax=Tahibacter sp. TaxID=2056211 RepID=UPI002CFF94A6|nr:FAD binding domain-containing protein [Tahibacter sp.]HSX58737.1 FAD binding domain-containing protein [Tahibacter sp.]